AAESAAQRLDDREVDVGPRRVAAVQLLAEHRHRGATAATEVERLERVRERAGREPGPVLGLAAGDDEAAVAVRVGSMEVGDAAARRLVGTEARARAHLHADPRVAATR